MLTGHHCYGVTNAVTNSVTEYPKPLGSEPGNELMGSSYTSQPQN